MKIFLPIFGMALIALLAWKTPRPEPVPTGSGLPPEPTSTGIGLTPEPASSVIVSAPAGRTPTPQTSKQGQTPGAGLTASIARGKTLYEQQCLSCHMVDGTGVPSMNPPLIKTSFVLGPKPALIKVVIAGMTGVEVDGDDFHNNMPPHPELTDQQVADVLTYIRHNFGNKATQVTVADVKAARAKK